MALAAHVDANRSHFLETMSLFGKVHESQMKNSSNSLVKAMVKGQLLIPHVGFSVEMRCGWDTMHLQLGNTMHVPDSSRDRHNWTRVHGP